MERAVHKSVHHESYGARGSHESGHDYGVVWLAHSMHNLGESEGMIVKYAR